MCTAHENKSAFNCVVVLCAVKECGEMYEFMYYVGTEGDNWIMKIGTIICSVISERL